MSLWTDARVKELLVRVSKLEERLDALVTPSIQQQYLEKFGKPPHHRMSEETIRAALG